MRTGGVSYSIRVVLGGVLLVFSGVDLLVSQPTLQGRVAYAENTFFVKFSQTARNQVVAAKTERVGRTGIASIDRLNKGAGVHRIAPVFRHAGRFEARLLNAAAIHVDPGLELALHVW